MTSPVEVVRLDGIAVVEVPDVKDMLERSEFDTIYHEHLCYFSLTAFCAAVASSSPFQCPR